MTCSSCGRLLLLEATDNHTYTLSCVGHCYRSLLFPPTTGQMASQTFRAARALGGALAIEAQARLPTLAPGQLRLRVAAVGVNPSDGYAIKGLHGRPLPAAPFTPGHDAAGTVLESTSAAFTPGDLVFTTKTLTGAFAEEAIVDAGAAYRLPPGCTPEQGACIGVPFFTAYRALFVTIGLSPPAPDALASVSLPPPSPAPAPGQRIVLVHGATGAVGTAACQMARLAGAFVIGTAGSAGGEAAIAPFCDAVLRHGDSAPAPVPEAVLALTSGRGADGIVEMLANVNLPADTRCVARGGMIAIVGSRGEVTINPRELMTREAGVRGVFLFHASPEESAAAGAFISAGLAAGALAPVVGRVFEGIETVAEAVDAVLNQAGGTTGKVVVKL